MTAPVSEADRLGDGGPLLRPVAGVERRSYGAETVIATADGRGHLLLDDADLAVFDSLDGSTTADALVDGNPDLADLIDDLSDAGFLDGVPPAAAPAVVMSSAGIEFDGFDRFVRVSARFGGRLLVTPVAAVAAVAIGIAGLVVIGSTGWWPPDDLTGESAVIAIWLLALTGVPSAVFHETAHGLVIDRWGRRVGRAGFGFYWGALSFFVDATDALLLPRRHRMGQALAGPAADFVLAGICAGAAWAVGPTPAGMVLRAIAVLFYLTVALNLVPLLQLDGYWFLSDLFNEPDLRSKSLQALRHPRQHPGRRGRTLAVFAVASIVFGVTLLAVAVLAWVDNLLPILLAALGAGPLGIVGAALFAGPLIIGAAAQLVHLARRATARPAPSTEGGEIP